MSFTLRVHNQTFPVLLCNINISIYSTVIVVMISQKQYRLSIEVTELLVLALCDNDLVLPFLLTDRLLLSYHAGDGEVYVWDMNTRSCVHKFRDEGCLKSTTLAASRDGQFLACGWVCDEFFSPCTKKVGDGGLVVTRWTLDREVRVQALTRSLCCVLGQDTLLPRCLSPPTGELSGKPG